MKDRILGNTEPKEVFHYFEDLTCIPRESGNEAAVCAYLVEFAKAHGLEYQTDDAHNIIMRRSAGKGFEDRAGVILQAHMDMVCEKNAGVEHDFAKDPISFEIEGDKIIARDTTLGADDGIGVALALAILADKSREYPALEFVCTADEERGMTGVEAFDVSTLRISVRGLLGGHSGEDIHRCRANSIKLLCRLLYTLKESVALSLVDFMGGLKYNAIPREAEAIIAVPAGDVAKVEELTAAYQTVVAKEYRFSDPDISITCAAADAARQVMTKASRDGLLNYLYFTQSGIVRMNPEFPDIVESSVSLGVVRLEAEQAVIHVMTRSSMKSMYEEMFCHIRRLTELHGATYEVMSCCPEWEYDPDSGVKKTCGELYQKLYGKAPKYMVLHAGLECGELGEKAPRKLDMISLGPDVRNLHSPGEYVTISSTQKVWHFLRELLCQL